MEPLKFVNMAAIKTWIRLYALWCLKVLMILFITPYVLGRHNDEDNDCRLFMALSTIPNAGIGVFTGVVSFQIMELRFGLT